MNGYQHQLGLSSSSNQPQKERANSPLRFKDLQSKQGSSIRQSVHQNVADEEEEYDRRRQEELRKHMKQPSTTYDTYGQQALRQSHHSNERYYSSSKYQSIAEKDQPYSHFTLGPAINTNFSGDQQQYRSNQSGETPPHIKEHISIIQSDNTSLMRRLNLVIQELERVNREKDEFYLRLKQSAKETSELQKMINSEDNVDKVNKFMNDDLLYERDRNHKIKQQIKELDLYRNDLIAELRRFQEQQNDIAQENQQLQYSLQSKLSNIQDIEKEHYFTSEKIKQMNQTIEAIKVDLMAENQDKLELQKILSQLIVERNDLLSRLEHLTLKYDECVRDISQQRAENETHNKQHIKLITAKIIFQQLEQIQKQRKTAGFQEFQQYCKFDSRCHNKLSEFSKLLEKIGHFRMRKGLRQWYSKALKPLQVKKQSQLLAKASNDQHLKFKWFIAWKALFDKKIQSYESKTKAINLMWHLQRKDKQIEIKRAFSIWKECLDNFKLRKNRVKKLVWKLYFNKLSAAMNTWINHTTNIDLQVRLNLLSSEFSQKQYLTILFNNFRYQATESKRKRQNILFHCLKSWKDYLLYQKFLMASNVAVLHFKKNLDSSILKQCYDAFRQHKEQERFLKVNQLLNEEELPLIEQLNNETEDIEVQRKFKAKNQAVQSIKKMMSKQLYGYIQHWKQLNEDYKEKLRTTLKDKIIKVYMEKIRKAFTYWKTLHDSNKLTQHQMVISEFQSEGQSLQNEVLDLKKDLEQKKEFQDQSQQKQVLKCVTSYQKRMKQLAMGRWRDRITDLNIKEGGAETIIRRLRLRFCRKAFDLYVAGVKYKKKQEKDEERCALYNRTRNERLKKQVMNVWFIFRDNHQKAKKYWNRMYLRLDLGMKQTALKKWKEQTQRKAEKELLSQQNAVIEKIEDLNHNIGELNQAEIEQKQEIKEKKDLMTAQAQRIIANAFARFYYISETRGFEKWREAVEFEKRKERILKKYVDHLRKYQFYFVKSTFQNWILNANIEQRKEQLKKEEMKVSDSMHLLDQQTKAFSVNKAKLQEELESMKKLQSMYNTRIQKSVQMIIGKVDNNNFMSQKRYILVKWREYVKREVSFIKCIEKVIQKSLWSKAFTEMRGFSRSVHNNNFTEDKLNKFRMKFWKGTCGNAFSVWRSGAFTLISTQVESVEQDTYKTISEYQDKKAKFKDVNNDRCERILQKNQLRNLYQSWKNVTQFLKLQNSKDSYYQEHTDLFRKKMAIMKWRGRKNATHLARIRGQRLKKKVYNIRLRQYFFALKNHYEVTKQFCIRISNLAKIHDHQALKMSINAILSFSKAKHFVHQTKKAHASRDLESILSSLISRRKHLYWRDLRIKTLASQKEVMLKSFTILQNIGKQMRHFFLKWKEMSNERSLLKEMHEEGPVREEVFEAAHEMRNLKKFMTKEGYNEREVQEALQLEKERQRNLILKSMRRMQHYNEELYAKPKMFDRWKQFVHIRKLFKYWLGFADKRGEYIKSDLHQAFDMWKNYVPAQFEALKKLTKRQLDARTLKNNRNLHGLSEAIQDKENGINNLNHQREALIDTYVLSQKMALSIWRGHRKRSLHQGFLKWHTIVKEIKNREMLVMLRSNLELIENLKNKINYFEQENDKIANENEDFRQFSLDGYEIAKNVQALTAEREKLSVDLADKAQVIRKLLDENENLTSKLRVAQVEASNLIQTTMGSQGFKSAVKGQQSSPLRRSALKY